MNETLRRRAPPLVVLILPLCFVAGPASAALFWQSGVHSNNISVCFVGDSLAQNNDFATLVMEYMEEFEWYSGIRFTYINGGICPAAVPFPDDPERDYFEGTIRIIIPGVTTVTPFGWVPGSGCPHDLNWVNPDGSYNGGNDGWGSWANPPSDYNIRRSCIYNVKLGTDSDPSGTPWRNHTLHEIGHAVGLAHEHVRNDVDPSCTAPGYGGSANSGFMTPYDRDSVMHYRFLACGIDGNYGHSGFSYWDQLALHILYPEANPTAEFRGKLLLRAGDTLSLTNGWQARGALINNVASGFVWLIQGSLVSFSPNLNITLPVPGEFLLQYAYSDSLVTVPTRSYGFSGYVRVLSAEEYDRLMGAIGNIATYSTATGMEDADGDGVLDAQDNCLGLSNAGQSDSDGDSIGNGCDADIAIPNDCMVNFLDLTTMADAFFSSPGLPGWNPDADLTGAGGRPDNAVNFLDLTTMAGQFFAPPGPSATGCN